MQQTGSVVCGVLVWRSIANILCNLVFCNLAFENLHHLIIRIELRFQFSTNIIHIHQTRH